MDITTATDIFAAYVARQRSRDRAGHGEHIRCGCPTEIAKDITLLDEATLLLPLETQRRIWQQG